MVESRTDYTIDEYLDNTADRGEACYALATVVGALVAGADPTILPAYEAIGIQLGICYQMKNDLADLRAPDALGKAGCSDLDARKMSAPVVTALNSRTAAGDRLAELYSQPYGEGASVSSRELLKLVEEAGDCAWTEIEVPAVRRPLTLKSPVFGALPTATLPPSSRLSPPP